MSWVLIDDDFPNHPKVVALGKQKVAAVAMQVMALCYANHHLTDGFIPREWVTDQASLKALLRVGLWTRAKGGFEIHDYLDFQPSRDDVEVKRSELHDKRSEAGKKGAAKRWQTKQADSKPVANPCPQALSPKDLRTRGSLPIGDVESAPAQETPPQGFSKTAKTFEALIGRPLGPAEIHTVRGWCGRFSIEVIDEALFAAAQSGKTSAAYITRIAERYHEEGVPKRRAAARQSEAAGRTYDRKPPKCSRCNDSGVVIGGEEDALCDCSAAEVWKQARA